MNKYLNLFLLLFFSILKEKIINNINLKKFKVVLNFFKKPLIVLALNQIKKID